MFDYNLLFVSLINKNQCIFLRYDDKSAVCEIPIVFFKGYLTLIKHEHFSQNMDNYMQHILIAYITNLARKN